MRIWILLLVLTFSAPASSAQVVDVPELHPSQLAALDRTRTVVLLIW